MNLYEVIKLCGLVPSESLFMEIVSQTATTVTIRFANQKEATVIYHTIRLT